MSNYWLGPLQGLVVQLSESSLYRENTRLIHLLPFRRSDNVWEYTLVNRIASGKLLISARQRATT